PSANPNGEGDCNEIMLPAFKSYFGLENMLTFIYINTAKEDHRASGLVLLLKIIERRLSKGKKPVMSRSTHSPWIACKAVLQSGIHRLLDIFRKVKLQQQFNRKQTLLQKSAGDSYGMTFTRKVVNDDGL